MYRRFNSPFVVLFMGAVLQAEEHMLVFELMAEGLLSLSVLFSVPLIHLLLAGSLYQLLHDNMRWCTVLRDFPLIRQSYVQILQVS